MNKPPTELTLDEMRAAIDEARRKKAAAIGILPIWDAPANRPAEPGAAEDAAYWRSRFVKTVMEGRKRQQQAEAAEARCAEFERDAARLDWLDRDDITLHFATRHGSPIVEVHRADTGELIAMRDTLRAAIDAARAK